MEFFQAIDALLDVLDATGTVLGLMALWYTWVVPLRIAPETVVLDVEHFLEVVTAAAPAPLAQPGAGVKEAGSVTWTPADRT